MRIRSGFLRVCQIVAALWFLISVSAAQTNRQVAITIDDLPAAASNFISAGEITDMTSKLLSTLRDQKVPAVGFVNEKKVYKFGEVDGRIKALQMWVDFGFELGNHTYSHISLNRAGLRAWEDDVIQGEPLLQLLLSTKNMKLRYFRHPYLDTGRDLQTRRQAEAFLVERGYRIAPVTLDAWDWMYAPVYDDAKKRGDTDLQQQLVKSYLSYSDAVFAYTEQLAVKTIGYEPKQILLLHGNQLEADHIGELIDVLRKRGYRFTTLGDALSDQAYGLPDTYVGEEGTGWVDHWAISLGKPPQGAPTFPQWVIDRAQQLRQPQP
jgi:peptidoglycan/xylan/chitin deacetylase (PgdA/CDA1 family)